MTKRTRLKSVHQQGGVKSTVSRVFEDLKFRISEGYKMKFSSL
jgi:hypothetical protein